MLTITKRFRFEAAHRLEDWPADHQCHRLHGHSYVLEVTLSGVVGNDPPKPGVIMDFAEIGKVVKSQVIEVFDHQYLNDLLKERNTTAEFLVKEIHRRIRPGLGNKVTIRLYETQDGWCDFTW